MNDPLPPPDWPSPIYDWDLLTDEEAVLAWQSMLDRYQAVAEYGHEEFQGMSKGKVAEPLRDYWAFAEQVLSAFLLLTSRGIKIPLPYSLLNTFRLLAGSFAVGAVPSMVSDTVYSGAPSSSPRARDNIAIAIAYVVAAKSGMINDAAPVKRVAEAYDVSSKTVQNWIRNKDRYRPSRSIPFDPTYLLDAMPQDAEAYRSKAPIRKGGRLETK